MAKFRFFSCLFRKTYKIESSPQLHISEGNGSVQVKLERLCDSNNDGSHKETSFNVSVPFGIEGSSTCKVKMVGDDNLINLDQTTGADPAYEASDEHDEKSSIKRDLSDFDLQAHDKQDEPVFTFTIDPDLNEKADRGKMVFFEINESGHVSDPGTRNRAGVFVDGSPKLKRSCSNLETRDLGKSVLLQLPSSNPNSFEDLQSLYDCIPGEEGAMQGSPLSVISADKVMLKRRSSSQVLPSRSRRLWWKLFLWSHRNLHKPMNIRKKQRPLFSISETSINKDGYASDTLEPGCSAQVMKGKTIQDSGKSDSSESFSGNLCAVKDGGKKLNFHGGVFESRPCNQWVAFSTESASFTRVDEWVNNLDTSSVSPLVDDEPEILESPRGEFEPENMDFSSAGSLEKTHYPYRQSNLNNTQEIIQANNIIHSLNSFTTVAHISGMGLKVIPAISPFSSLRSINLSGNFIVHISPGSLPKSLHTLNLSRNKIVTIEGLRDLTRLRVLDLSYNRIARIAHGLSNCTLIKELYLAGNKISDVEGLHRLLKLTVLDLSFNKITTTKALGQLVANYHSMLALNLLGNPIQTNIGDDQLRRAVIGLLPQLTYLNKQPIKPQRAREVAKDSVAKAALGGSWNAHRKSGRRGTSQGGGGLGFTASLKSKNVSSVSPTARGTKGGVGGAGDGPRNRHKSKTRHSSAARRS